MSDVIQFPSEPPRVVQSDLERIVALREHGARLEAERKAIEQQVREAIEAGARIEPGVRVAFLRECHRDGYTVQAADYRQLVVK